MSFALLQKDLAIPSVECLKRAFRKVKFLTDLDAHTLSQDAYGILVKNLSEPDALALQTALHVEGIETETVAERSLPALPATKFVKRLDCRPDALFIYDPIGRNFPVAWGHLWLIAAGFVRLREFKTIRKAVPVTRSTADGMPYTDVEIEIRSKEELNYRFLLELVLTRAVARYTIEPEKFNWQYLGPRVSKSTATNFTLLVKDLVQFAPQATLNRGACCLRDDAPEPFSYPSKNAFFEEVVWLLWRLNQAALDRH